MPRRSLPWRPQVGKAMALILLALASGCGHQPAAPVHPPLKRIYVLPVVSPQELTARDHEGLYPGVNWVDALRLRSLYNDRGQLLTKSLSGERGLLGEKMSAALLKELSAQGY